MLQSARHSLKTIDAGLDTHSACLELVNLPRSDAKVDDTMSSEGLRAIRLEKVWLAKKHV